PASYGLVAPGIYRSNTPPSHTFPFLRTLHLRTAVILSPEQPTRALVQFFEECGTTLVQVSCQQRPSPQRFGFNLGAADTWRPISDRLVKDVLELVLDRTRHPLLLMCSSGVYETGIVVGCLRRLQGWSLTSILSEYGNVAATAGRMPRVGHEQFVELFDLDLI
ncbi:hypothetical protein CXG81DRAFT_6213, partial [Caulochytrium protostelioides]